MTGFGATVIPWLQHVDQELFRDPSGGPEFTPGFQWGSCCSMFYYVLFKCRLAVCPFIIVLSVLLRFMASGCPFGILEFFFLSPNAEYGTSLQIWALKKWFEVLSPFFSFLW
jgi:hypothetical protein